MAVQEYYDAVCEMVNEKKLLRKRQVTHPVTSDPGTRQPLLIRLQPCDRRPWRRC